MALKVGMDHHHKEVIMDHLKVVMDHPHKEVITDHLKVVTEDHKEDTEHHKEDMEDPKEAVTDLPEVITDLSPGLYKDGKTVTVKATKMRMWSGRVVIMPTQQLVL